MAVFLYLRPTESQALVALRFCALALALPLLLRGCVECRSERLNLWGVEISHSGESRIFREVALARCFSYIEGTHRVDVLLIQKGEGVVFLYRH